MDLALASFNIDQKCLFFPIRSRRHRAAFLEGLQQLGWTRLPDRLYQKEKGISREAADAIWLDEVPLRRMGRAEDFGKLAAVLVSDVAS